MKKDPSTVTAPFQWERNPDLSKLRIGFDEQAPKDFVAKLRELGAQPKPMPARPSTRGINTLPIETAVAFDFYVAAGMNKPPANSAATGGAPQRFENGRTITALDYLQSQRRRQILMRAMAEIMKDFDMYVSGAGDVQLTNQTGHPAVIVPYAMTEGEHSQPRCATIIGNLFADDKILSVAHAYQRATDWHQQHPKL